MGKVDVKLAKDVAWLRHTRTNYDKHYDLMFDADGNPTPLRKRINAVLGKILTGELDPKFLGGIKSEIKNAQKELNHQKHLRINKKTRASTKIIVQRIKGDWSLRSVLSVMHIIPKNES